MSKIGLLYALGAYVFWGLLPIYWKLLSQVPALEVVSQRTAWSLPLLFIFIIVSKQWHKIVALCKQPKILALLAISSVLLTINWLIYVWSIEVNRLTDSSLGYFINPLLSVFFGVIFLKENISKLQIFAILIAAIGVLYLAIIGGVFPWIGIALAVTFASYNLLRKMIPVESLTGLFIEVCMVTPFAMIYLIYMGRQDSMMFINADMDIKTLLIMSGLITALPLIWVVKASKLLPLSIVGILQYINPSLQFLIAVLLFNEPLGKNKLIAFIFIWAAVILFIFDNWRKSRKNINNDRVLLR